ncbi:MAG: PIG-L family deacetylase [Candidatus Kapabacteria bacterium]|nr:PIG-L family deacetylase [Candidatus Kapabacteria bacterium]
MKKILIVSVHPDDEALGCGGTIGVHNKLGDELYWLILTSPKEISWVSEDFKERRKIEIKKAIEHFNFKKTFELDLPTTMLDTLANGEIIKQVSKIIDEIKPEIVYLPNRSDIHSDHKIAFQVLISSTKYFRYPFVKRILMYETLSETEFAPPLPENSFLPNVFIDITEFINYKLKSIDIYSESEMMPYPLPRNKDTVKALARFRGARIGVEYAEAFMLILEVL